MGGAYCPLPPPRTFPAVFPSVVRLDRIYQRGFASAAPASCAGANGRAYRIIRRLLAELELP